MPPGYIKIREIKPALCAYIREASSMLEPDVVPSEDVVHDVRVLMKKSRAVMKLLKNQVDTATLEKEYETFRTAGRILRSWRESSVHRKILKGLRKRNAALFSQIEGNQKISLLLQKPDAGPSSAPGSAESVGILRSMLLKSGYRLRFRNFTELDPGKLLKALEKTYLEVADKYMVARNNPKPANLHELRKRIKDLLYQLYFFRSLGTKAIKDMETRLDRLAQNLGRYNDYETLLQALDYEYSSHSDRDQLLDELAVVVRNKQDRYLRKIWPEAYSLFGPGINLENLLGYKILMI